MCIGRNGIGCEEETEPGSAQRCTRDQRRSSALFDENQDAFAVDPDFAAAVGRVATAWSNLEAQVYRFYVLVDGREFIEAAIAACRKNGTALRETWEIFYQLRLKLRDPDVSAKLEEYHRLRALRDQVLNGMWICDSAMPGFMILVDQPSYLLLYASEISQSMQSSPAGASKPGGLSPEEVRAEGRAQSFEDLVSLKDEILSLSRVFGALNEVVLQTRQNHSLQQ
jgi:hypothetical protein